MDRPKSGFRRPVTTIHPFRRRINRKDVPLLFEDHREFHIKVFLHWKLRAFPSFNLDPLSSDETVREETENQ